jgi:hypothetical protein
MIRRDYLLRMIQEFLEMISRISSLKRSQQWQEAASLADKELRKLAGSSAQELAQLSETELLARLVQGEPTQIVREKTFMLVTLLSEAGDIATAQERSEDGRACYLKGLNLLLDLLAEDEISASPSFVPKIEVLVTALADQPLPRSTQARLMLHYERTGDFAKAEDALFSLIDAEPDQPGLIEFGRAFYKRLSNQSDAALAAGNLPRPEIEAGLEELRHLIST